MWKRFCRYLCDERKKRSNGPGKGRELHFVNLISEMGSFSYSFFTKFKLFIPFRNTLIISYAIIRVLLRFPILRSTPQSDTSIISVNFPLNHLRLCTYVPLSRLNNFWGIFLFVKFGTGPRNKQLSRLPTASDSDDDLSEIKKSISAYGV